MTHRTSYVERTDKGFGIFQQTELGSRIYIGMSCSRKKEEFHQQSLQSGLGTPPVQDIPST